MAAASVPAVRRSLRRPVLPKLEIPIPKSRFYPFGSNQVVSQQSEVDLNFEMGRTLGSGSTGSVCLATRRSDGKMLAIKRYLSEDEEVHSFAKQEFDLLMEMDHKSVVQVESFYTRDHVSWLVVELCKDGSVESWIEKHGPLSEGHAGHMAKQLLEGVSYLHAKRIVHRDLKPDNLLLTDEARVLKIADFNSAKKLIGVNGSAMLSDRGTRLFSAPELRFQAMWNERVDEWACGFCIYFMVKAELPLKETLSSVRLLRKGKLPEVNFYGVSDLLQNLVLQCLTVDMLDRPPVLLLVLHPFFDQDVVRCFAQKSSPCSCAGHPSVETKDCSYHSDGENDCNTWRISSNSIDSDASGDLKTRRSALRCKTWVSCAGYLNQTDTDVPDMVADKGYMGEWKESRDGRHALKKLANDVCHRSAPSSISSVKADGHTSGQGGQAREAAQIDKEVEVARISTASTSTPNSMDLVRTSSANSSPTCRASKCVSRGTKDRSRYWTTHGASEVSDKIAV